MLFSGRRQFQGFSDKPLIGINRKGLSNRGNLFLRSISKKVYQSIVNFRNNSIKRSEISEKKYLESRSKYVSYEN